MLSTRVFIAVLVCGVLVMVSSAYALDTDTDTEKAGLVQHIDLTGDDDDDEQVRNETDLGLIDADLSVGLSAVLGAELINQTQRNYLHRLTFIMRIKQIVERVLHDNAEQLARAESILDKLIGDIRQMSSAALEHLNSSFQKLNAIIFQSKQERHHRLIRQQDAPPSSSSSSHSRSKRSLPHIHDLGINFTIASLLQAQTNFNSVLDAFAHLELEISELLAGGADHHADVEALHRCEQIVDELKTLFGTYETRILVTIHEAIMDLNTHLHLNELVDNTASTTTKTPNTNTTTRDSEDRDSDDDIRQLDRIVKDEARLDDLVQRLLVPLLNSSEERHASLLSEQLSHERAQHELKQRRLEATETHVSALLAKQEQLQAQLAQLKDELHGAHLERIKAVGEHTQATFALKSTLEATREQLKEAKDETSRRTEAAIRAQISVEQAQSDASQLRRLLAAKEKETHACEANVITFQEANDELIRLVEENSKELKAREAELVQRNSLVAQLHAEISQMQRALALRDIELLNHTLTAEERNAASQRLLDDIGQLRAQYEQCGAELVAKEREQQEAHATIERLRDMLTKHGQEAAQHAHQEQRLVELEQEASAAGARIEQLEHALSGAEDRALDESGKHNETLAECRKELAKSEYLLEQSTQMCQKQSEQFAEKSARVDKLAGQLEVMRDQRQYDQLVARSANETLTLCERRVVQLEQELLDAKSTTTPPPPPPTKPKQTKTKAVNTETSAATTTEAPQEEQQPHYRQQDDDEQMERERDQDARDLLRSLGRYE